MRWRFSQGATDYDTLKSFILTYTQHVRFDAAYSKADNDMQIDEFGYEKSDEWSDWIAVAQPAEVAAYYEGMHAGLASECPHEPVGVYTEDLPLDALYRKGKGKGKGKKGKGRGELSREQEGKGNGYRPQGHSQQNVARPGEQHEGKDGGKGKTKLHCSWFHIQGHLARDCRKKAAGEPRANAAGSDFS